MCEAESYLWRSLFPESPRHRPCQRSKQAGCRVRGQIYLHGGRGGHQTLRDFWRYDVASNIWARLDCGGDTPPPLQEHTMVAHKGCLYVFGGELGYGSCGETPLWVYSLARQTWEKPHIESEVVTPTGRRGHSAVVWRGGMHIYGGYVDLKGSSGEMWTLDFETRWWHLSVDAQLESAPTPRHWHSAVVRGSCMWAYGGLNNLQPLRDLWRWNFESRQWTRVKGRQSPSFLHGHTAVCLSSSMLVFGGEDSEGEYRNELWRFHFASSSWQCTAPNRRLAPTSCTRHLMLAVPANQMVATPAAPGQGWDPRPQSAPTGTCRNVAGGEGEDGGGRAAGSRLLTPPSRLADLFVLRPHSSPPVVGSGQRTVHHHPFTNRVHPSPDEELGPRRTLFDSDWDEADGADGEVDDEEDSIAAAIVDEGDGGKTVDGKWVVAVALSDPAGRRRRPPPGEESRTPRKIWATTATVSPGEVPEGEAEGEGVEEGETGGLLLNEASPVHRRPEGPGEPGGAAPPLHDDEDCILEEFSPRPVVVAAPLLLPNGEISERDWRGASLSNSDLPRDGVNRLAQASGTLFPPPPESPPVRFLSENGSVGGHTSPDPSREPQSQAPNSPDGARTATDLAGLPSVPTPIKPKFIVEPSSPVNGRIVTVAALGGDVSENHSVEVGGDGRSERRKLLPPGGRPLATFVNYGFVSSHEDLLREDTDAASPVTNGSTNPARLERDSRLSHVELPVAIGQLREMRGEHGQSGYSQPPALIPNGSAEHSEAEPHHLSRAMLYARRGRGADGSEPGATVPAGAHRHRFKPVHQRVCQITVEEAEESAVRSNAATPLRELQHLQQQQQQQVQISAGEPEGTGWGADSRPRLHGRSQTLNSLPDRQRASGQPTAGQPPMRHDGDGQVHHREAVQEFGEEEEEWAWPVFLYLMGGEETGASSLHQSSSPMSVWKCCMARGKQTESELQQFLSQY